MTSFSERVKALRKQRGYTQEDLAGKLNVTRHYISMLESGSAPSPQLEMLFTILEENSTDALLNPDRESTVREHSRDYRVPDRRASERFRAQLLATMEKVQGWLEELPVALSEAERQKIMNAARRALDDFNEWQQRQSHSKQ